MRQLGGRLPTAGKNDVQEQRQGLAGPQLGVGYKGEPGGPQQRPDRLRPKRSQRTPALIDNHDSLDHSARGRGVSHHDLIDQVTAVIRAEHRRGGREDLARRTRLRGSWIRLTGGGWEKRHSDKEQHYSDPPAARGGSAHQSDLSVELRRRPHPTPTPEPGAIQRNAGSSGTALVRLGHRGGGRRVAQRGVACGSRQVSPPGAMPPAVPSGAGALSLAGPAYTRHPLSGVRTRRPAAPRSTPRGLGCGFGVAVGAARAGDDRADMLLSLG